MQKGSVRVAEPAMPSIDKLSMAWIMSVKMAGDNELMLGDQIKGASAGGKVGKGRGRGGREVRGQEEDVAGCSLGSGLGFYERI